MDVKMEPLQKFGFCNGSVVFGKKGRFSKESVRYTLIPFSA